jgi:hypothetical protein
MAKAEKITHNGEVYAIIVRGNIKVEGVEFFTPKEYPFQLGVHLREPGLELKPHSHKEKRRIVEISQEMLHICEGKVEVNFYDENKKQFATSILNSGDTILFVRGGHGFKILEKTRIIEVKQGPYEGLEKDKEMI